MTTSKRSTHLDVVLADKAELRRQAKMKSWPEKIAIIERLRDSTREARQAMKERLGRK